MKFKSFLIAVLVAAMFVSFSGCSKSSKSLNDQLNDLEKIIVKYEPKFNELKYNSKEYTDMITEYNKEINGWAKIFEIDRYEKNSNGKLIPKQEFKDVETRFSELNQRMSRMILENIARDQKSKEQQSTPPEVN